MAQSIGGVVAGLKTAADTIYGGLVDEIGAPAQVVMSTPGQYQANYIVAVATQVRQQITRPTHGPSRSREAEVEVDVILSVFVPGDESMQPVANDRALSMQGLLEAYLRTSPNETLGGACRDAWVSAANMLTEIAYQQSDDPTVAPVPTGRIAENTVTVTARIRY